MSLVLLAHLLLPGISGAGGVGDNSLFIQLGTIRPHPNDSAGVETAPHLALGFLHQPGARWAIGGKMEYLAWNGTPTAFRGRMAVSDVWRCTANMRFDLSESNVTPFATFGAGLAPFHWEGWVDFEDVAGILPIEGLGLTPTFEAGLGLSSHHGPLRVSVTSEWLGFLSDNLADSLSLSAGVEIRL